ncbi:MAG TPA: ABC transporter permease [Nocardioides sp.]|nr:ABC transporter permease [Nocardioides sp.]
MAPVTPGLAAAPVPFRRLVLVELRKVVDTRSGRWLLLSAGLLVGLFEVALLLSVTIQALAVSFEDFAAGAGGITSVFLPVLGILLVTSEWGQRTAMVTFALEPRRIRVVLAKLAVGLVLTLVTVGFMVAVATIGTGVAAVARPGLASWDVGVEGFAGYLVVQALTMTVGFALACLTLSSPAAIVTFFLYWGALPLVLYTLQGLFPAFEDAAPWINFQSALDPVRTWTLDSGEQWGQLLVGGALWIGVPLALGLWRILRAEVK